MHPPWGGVCTPLGGNACNLLKCAASTGVGIAGVGITGVGIAGVGIAGVGIAGASRIP